MENINHTHEQTISRYKIRLGPAGFHFFNRTTGVNILVDEVIPDSERWSAAPRQVSIALTNVCDLACAHCYAPKNSYKLPFDNIIGWLKELDENGCVGVGFGGGEPTLYPRFAELCCYTAKETNLAVTFTTHGHRLSDSLICELAGNIHFVRVSLDGVGATYESIRQHSFDALLQHIKKIRTIAPFGINFLVNCKTICDLDSAIEIAEDLGATEFLLLPELAAGRGAGIDEDTQGELHQWVTEYHGSIPLSVSEISADGLPVCYPLKAERGLSSYAHIDASGVLKNTSFDKNGVTIRENGVMAALHQLKN